MNKVATEELKKVLQHRYNCARQRKKRNGAYMSFSNGYYSTIAQGQMEAYKAIAKDFGITLQTTGKVVKER